jgi:sporulation protein YlmC with PRC-barrel domain
MSVGERRVAAGSPDQGHFEGLRHSKDNMQSKQFTAALALLTVPALSFVYAQEPATAPRARAGQSTVKEAKDAHFATASKLIGQDVLGRATTNGERKDIGDVRDFIVDGASGAVTHVIVSSGGVGSLGDTLRSLPFADLRFDRTDPKQPKVWLDVTEADFDALGKITNESLDVYRCKTIAEAHLGHQSRVREAGAKVAPKDGVIADGHLSLIMLASELDDFDVRALIGSVDEKGDSMAGESVGSVHEAWIDCSAGKVAYLTLEHNRRFVALPMASLVPAVDMEKKTIFFETPCTVLQLAAAPALDEKASLTFDNADFRKSITEYFAGVKPTPIGE